MTFAIFAICVSLVILYFSANWLVQGGASFAKRLGVSPLIIGLTMVSFGTSAPELVVSIQSSMQGQGALSLGNVLGSNLFNIGIILGVSAMIYPLFVKKQLFKLDAPVMIVSTILFLITFRNGKLNFWEAAIYMTGFVTYIGYLIYKTLKSKKRGIKESEDSDFSMTRHWSIDWLLIIVGLVGLVYGSDLLVDNSIIVARTWGMSEAMIGLTIVAVGTSMPELATSIVAALKKQADIAIGNVMGSNIFNILLIIGTAGLINPIETHEIDLFDGLYLLGITLLLFVFMLLRRNINRAEGFVLFLLYLIYFAYKLFFAS